MITSSNIGPSKGFSLNSNGKEVYYHDSKYSIVSGKWTENLSGTLPGGYTYTGRRTSYSGSKFIESKKYPKIITKITIKKKGFWFANVKFTSERNYKKIFSKNYLVYDKITTNTKFKKGDYRNSVITTIDQYDTSGKHISTKIRGNAKGRETIKGKKVYYTSKITMPTTVTSIGITKISTYKEKRYSKKSKLIKKIPYESLFYKEIHQPL